MAPSGTCFSLFVTLLAVTAADAQTQISAIKGAASIRHGDTGQPVAGQVDTPLLPDDRLATSPNSRVDIRFDSTHTLRLGSNTEVRLLQPAPGQYQTELIKGGLALSTPGITVDTPSISVRPANQGAYRIAVNAAGESEITVRAGQVEVFAPSGSQSVGAGQKMVARGSPSDPEFKIVSALPKWRRAAKIFFASVQLGEVISSSSSDDKSSSKTAPKPASKTTPVPASNGSSKSTPPARGGFSPAPSTHAASPASSSSFSHNTSASSSSSSSPHSKE